MIDLKQAREERLRSIQDELGIENVEAVPRVEKLIVNVGLGDAPSNAARVELAREQLARITGQEPVVTRARKSVAGFGIRKGDPAGLKVTLRGRRMEDFIERLVHLALPRTKDFKGLDPESFDGQGNYSLGVDEQVVFPEISYEEADEVFGMDITFVTSVESTEKARVLLEEYGLPLRS